MTTLKTDYTGALDAALSEAFTKGEALANANIGYTGVLPNLIPLPLTAACKNAAAQGLSTFTVFITTSDVPEILRLNGDYLKVYLAGIYAALYTESIYQTLEVVLSLDTSTVGVNKIKFSFTF